MATDEALLDQVIRSGGAFLRLYRWNPPTLSIGRNQALEGVVRDDLPWVRRPTGGTAVWHEHEVTYAVAAPIALFGSLRNAYCQIHTRIAAALRSLGVDAVLAPAVRPFGRPAACFAAPVGGEILAGGRKLVGSAQVRRGTAFLQHGSVLLAGSQERLGGVTGETTMLAVLGRTVTFAEITTAIVANWGETFGPSERPAVRPSAAVASPAAG
jgi:lipoate-protein ligase A